MLSKDEALKIVKESRDFDRPDRKQLLDTINALYLQVETGLTSQQLANKRVAKAIRLYFAAHAGLDKGEIPTYEVLVDFLLERSGLSGLERVMKYAEKIEEALYRSGNVNLVENFPVSGSDIVGMRANIRLILEEGNKHLSPKE